MGQNHHIESFIPQLRSDVEILYLNGGAKLLFRQKDAHYFVPSAEESGFVDLFKAGLPLSEIALKAAAQGERLSIHLLLMLVAKLFRDGWLENTAEEVHACLGDSADAPSQPIKTLIQRIGRWGIYGEAKAINGTEGTGKTQVGSFLGVTTLALLSAVTLLSIQLFSDGGTNALAKAPTYLWGLGYFYCGMVLVGTVRFVCRLLWLQRIDSPIFRMGLGFPFLILAPVLDGRHIYRKGAAGHRGLALAGMLGTSLGLLLLVGAGIGAAPGDGQNFFLLAAMGGVLYLLGLLAPFFPGDLHSYLRWRSDDGQDQSHTLSYMRSQLLRRQGLAGLFKGEASHVLVVTCMVLWLFSGFKFSAFLFSGGLTSATALFADDVSFLEFTLVSSFLLGIGFLASLCLVTFFAGLGQIIFGHIPTIEVKPQEFPDNPSVVDVLANCPLFARLNEEVLSELAGHCRTLKYQKSQRIVEKGTAGDEFFLIQNGRAGVFDVAPTGLEVPLATLDKGESFGDIALLEDAQIRRATVRALTDVECVVLKRADFLSALEKSGVAQQEVRSLLQAAHAIRGSALFSHLSPATVLRLVSLSAFEEFSPGDVVIN